MPSFDIVSQVNAQEVKNALEQANKEIQNRYDFKGSDARIEQAEMAQRAIGEILRGRSQARSDLQAGERVRQAAAGAHLGDSFAGGVKRQL